MEFNGPGHFFDCMKLLNLKPDLINIINTLNSFASIPNGCGCQRQNRVNSAVNSYNNLVNILTDLEKLFLKAAYSNQTIIFKDGERILGQF